MDTDIHDRYPRVAESRGRHEKPIVGPDSLKLVC